MITISVLIPARHEEFLQQTIDDVFAHAETNVEVLVALDNWENPPCITVKQGQIITTRAGQRGATNLLARLAKGKYVMKLDAHCSLSQGFDRNMLEDMEEDVTMVMGTCNLHAYDWVCPEGHRHFQGLYEKCEQCGSIDLKKDFIWNIVHRPMRSTFYFDTSLHFQYMPTDPPDQLLMESMSIQGSGFLCTRNKYWELDICDEAFGSWGQQGTEVACKTWLSGGRVLSTRKTWYGHQFRETEGFPYPNPTGAILAAQEYSRDIFLNNKWPKQVRSFQSLIRQFNYPGDWSEEKLTELCTGGD